MKVQQDFYQRVKKNYPNLRASDIPIPFLDKAILINYLSEISSKDLAKYLNPTEKFAVDLNAIKSEANTQLLRLLLGIKDEVDKTKQFKPSSESASPSSQSKTLQNLDKKEKMLNSFMKLLNEKLAALDLNSDMTPKNPNNFNLNDPNHPLNPNNPNNILRPSPPPPANLLNQNTANSNNINNSNIPNNINNSNIPSNINNSNTLNNPGNSNTMTPTQIQDMKTKLTDTISKQLGVSSLTPQAKEELTKMVTANPGLFDKLSKNNIQIPPEVLMKLGTGNVGEIMNKLNSLDESSYDFVIDTNKNFPCNNKVNFLLT
jgi:hypothetical protein